MLVLAYHPGQGNLAAERGDIGGGVGRTSNRV